MNIKNFISYSLVFFLSSCFLGLQGKCPNGYEFQKTPEQIAELEADAKRDKQLQEAQQIDQQNTGPVQSAIPGQTEQPNTENSAVAPVQANL